MRNKLLFTLVIIASLFLTTCTDDKDPGPDLSGKITFKWTIPNIDPQRSGVYVLLSDSSGNSLGWRDLTGGELVEMPYPPAGQTANVSIITHSTFSDNTTSEFITTYTNVPGGDYFYTRQEYIPLTPDGSYEVKIHDISNYNVMNIYVSSQIGIEENYTTELFSRKFGLINGRSDDLLISLKKFDQPWRYHYKTGLTIGGSTDVTAEFYDTLKTMPSFVLDFPEFNTMSATVGGITAHSSDYKYVSFISSFYYMKNEIPLVNYLELPRLFDKYETYFYAIDGDEQYAVDIVADAPVRKMILLKVDLTKKESFNTKRISLKFNGEGDIFSITGSFGNAQAGVNWAVFAPKSSSVTINLPQFPDDLVAQLPALVSAKDKEFRDVSISNLNMSYTELVNMRFTGGWNNNYDYYVGKGFFGIDKDNSRVGIPTREEAMQHYRQMTGR